MFALETTRALLTQDACPVDPAALPFGAYLTLSTQARAALQPLPFWHGAFLAALEDPAVGEECPMWFVVRNERAIFLDGTSTPLHTLNRWVPLQWDSESVFAYLKFFCFFLRLPEGGPFLIVDSPAALASQRLTADTEAQLRQQLRPPIIDLTDDTGMIETGLLYRGDLYWGRYVVQRNGEVFMPAETLLCRLGLPVTAPMLKSLAPLLREEAAVSAGSPRESVLH